MKNIRLKSTFFIGVLLLASGQVLSQVVPVSIRVLDEVSAQPIFNAKITISESHFNFKSTEPNGVSIFKVKPGQKIHITVSAEGYQSAIDKEFNVSDIPERNTLTIRLFLDDGQSVIYGNIKDQNLNVISGADITIKIRNHEYRTTTNELGNYSVLVKQSVLNTVSSISIILKHNDDIRQASKELTIAERYIEFNPTFGDLSSEYGLSPNSEATYSAWRYLKKIDEAFGNFEEQVNPLYLQYEMLAEFYKIIDFNGVDAELVNHINECIVLYNSIAHFFKALDTEVKNQVGEKTREKYIFKASKAVFNKYKSEITAIESKVNALAEKEKQLGAKLSKKYRRLFESM
ncbi:carboxypeptidase-like regulatory domain-containing protein [Phaeodactylibacter sp.]|uniref:carboxypeptidase-like regulatory domain-containing protein n=1 Tax=Phaeodactylibacter sp. TaxID=1940289 RepID=UPI0025DFF125|nr:carboxypeptidase-like regulatory domain-containing protein [Phaeodactylibacter sp.]MCI5091626.1 carboxypeptidase-like regulatory domain-containing protein [Phaeodactylibacter sp.]